MIQRRYRPSLAFETLAELKEGIGGRNDEDDAVARICSLTGLAVELGRKDSRACVLAWMRTQPLVTGAAYFSYHPVAGRNPPTRNLLLGKSDERPGHFGPDHPSDRGTTRRQFSLRPREHRLRLPPAGEEGHHGDGSEGAGHEGPAKDECR